MGVVPIVNENDTVSVSVGSDLLYSFRPRPHGTRKLNLATMTPSRPSPLP
jgi:hypothetical protein